MHALHVYLYVYCSCTARVPVRANHWCAVCAAAHVYSSFGELALLYSAPRAATVRSTMACKLWVMQRSVYLAIKRNFTHELVSCGGRVGSDRVSK